MGNPRPNKCCDVQDNLKRYMEKPELAVEECKVCGCKHRRLIVETAIFHTTQEDVHVRKNTV
jgi:hypothetical protein